MRESFAPVQRNAMPTAPAHAPALISKIQDWGWGLGLGLGRGWAWYRDFSSCKKASSLGFPKALHGSLSISGPLLLGEVAEAGEEPSAELVRDRGPVAGAGGVADREK